VPDSTSSRTEGHHGILRSSGQDRKIAERKEESAPCGSRGCAHLERAARQRDGKDSGAHKSIAGRG